MPKVVHSPDCGHSPKNQFLQDLAIARWTCDRQALDRMMTDDIAWNVIGGEKLFGKETVLDAVANRKLGVIAKLTIVHVSQHGKVGAVNGWLKFRTGAMIDFCDICEFASVKGTSVSSVTSYEIKSAGK